MGERTFSFSTRLKPIDAKIELAPVMDLLFILLIFFMVSSSFFRVSGVSVELPGALNASSQDVGRCVVTLQGNGVIYFNEHPVNMEKLKRNFQNLNNRKVRTFILQADTSVPYGHVVELLCVAQEYDLAPLLATKLRKERAVEPVHEEE